MMLVMMLVRAASADDERPLWNVRGKGEVYTLRCCDGLAPDIFSPVVVYTRSSLFRVLQC